MSNLKRSNTIETIKRAGTDAWKWINAEDTDIDINNPIGFSYFQRNDTLKELNSINSINSIYYEKYNQSYNNPSNELVYSLEYDDNLHSINITNNDYGEFNINNPEPVAVREEEERKPKISSVLNNPDVRRQLENLKKHKPYFMYTMTFIHIVVLIISLIKYYTSTGNIMAPLKENIMFGPDSGILIQFGSRFVPCMKATEYSFIECPKSIKSSIRITKVVNSTQSDTSSNTVYRSRFCTLSDICQFGLKKDETPNQWFRFILPIFLHGGILHLVFNLVFQVRTGVQMEKDFGSWRIMIIYMISGIFGFAFGASYSGNSSSVGCSGALYGLLACLLLDLFQNWKLIIKPWKELTKMLAVIILSLGIGLIPYIDNFAHIGGFIAGILTGLIFMPTIIFSKNDLRIKRILMIISIILTIISFIWVFEQFYDKTSECSWCQYLNCIPIKNGWCNNFKKN